MEGYGIARLNKVFEGLLSFCCLANIVLCLLLYYIASTPELQMVVIRLKLMVSLLTALGLLFMVLAKLTMAKIIKDAVWNWRKLASDILVKGLFLLPHPNVWTHGMQLGSHPEGYYLDDLLMVCVLLRIVLLGKILFKSLSYYGTR